MVPNCFHHISSSLVEEWPPANQAVGSHKERRFDWASGVAPNQDLDPWTRFTTHLHITWCFCKTLENLSVDCLEKANSWLMKELSNNSLSFIKALSKKKNIAALSNWAMNMSHQSDSPKQIATFFWFFFWKTSAWRFRTASRWPCFHLSQDAVLCYNTGVWGGPKGA